MKKEYPEIKAIASSENACVVRHSSFGHLCGYFRFKNRPLIESGYNGILQYVPVHGGITYAEETKNGMVYGFDCSHVDDEKNTNLQSIEYVLQEAKRMGEAILIAAKYERRFLKVEGFNEKRARVLEAYFKEVEKKTKLKFNLQDNFGAMLSVIGGKL